jgi:hypothetical protein
MTACCTAWLSACLTASLPILLSYSSRYARLTACLAACFGAHHNASRTALTSLWLLRLPYCVPDYFHCCFPQVVHVLPDRVTAYPSTVSDRVCNPTTVMHSSRHKMLSCSVLSSSYALQRKRSDICVFVQLLVYALLHTHKKN